ncbi:pLS20_p028 family conjugation system transmembrane protein [Listeria monocytogenes]|nr:hypothetical protein [Listeria monocytogenes]EAF4467813.1 hypothetical protein [Listeria monocytogenes serotype 1/2a]EAD0722622.1 hypothetical protein [Listeria monocytogenes]EAD1931371.1 hypothetical protein [Listeria monocytogenes]EAD3056036.1 hypothetical protein [Listeria monocytogenes]
MNWIRKRKTSLTVLVLLTIAVFFSDILYVHAETMSAYMKGIVPKNNDEIVSFYKSFDAVISQTGFWAFVGRSLGWWIIDLLVLLVNTLSEVFSDIATLFHFYDSQGMKDLLDRLSVLQVAFATIVILGLAVSLALYGKKANFGEAMTNLFFVALILLFLPLGMDKAMDIVTSYINEGSNSQSPSGQQQVGESSSGFDPGSEIILSNTSDIYAFAMDNFQDPNMEKKHYINDYKTINPIEVIDIDLIKTYSPDKGAYFEKRIDYLPQTDGTEKAVAVDREELGGILEPLEPMIGDTTYRYTYNFWTIVLTLIITALVLLLSAFKAAGIMIDIAFNYVFASILGFLDFRTMSRFKRVVESIFSSIAVIMIIPVMITIYTLFNAFVVSQSIGVTSQLICLAAAGYYVINGPEQVTRVLGIDAGVKNGWNLIGGAIGIKKGAESVANIAGSAAEKAAGIGGFIAGYTANSAEDDGESNDNSLYDDKKQGENDSETGPGGEENQEESNGLYQNDAAENDGSQDNELGAENEESVENNVEEGSLYEDDQITEGETGQDDSQVEEAGLHDSISNPDSMESNNVDANDQLDSMPTDDTTSDQESGLTDSDTMPDSSRESSESKGESTRNGSVYDDNQTVSTQPSVNDENQRSLQGSLQQMAKDNRFAKAARSGYDLGSGTAKQRNQNKRKKQLTRAQRKQKVNRSIEDD